MTATVAVLAVVGVAAQLGSFQESDEGQLWQVIHEINSGEDGSPNGVVYVGGTLFVADDQQRTITAHNSSGAVIGLSNPDPDWEPFDAVNPLSPVYGWAPNQLATATVQINGGPDQTAILVSDGNATRALAFDRVGRYLFTILLDRPLASPEEGSAINGLAMGPGAKFVLTTTATLPTLRLIGSFAASWADDFGRVGVGVDGAVLVYRDQSFESRGQLQFFSDPVAELTGTEGATPGPVAREPYGVTFDPAGNLYTVDAVTERLNVYAPVRRGGFRHLFNFGTPAGDGTAEFYQSFGMAFWPDAAGGRLFIADAINNRVVVYRPNLPAKTLDFLFEIDGLGALEGYPFSVAIDPLTATLAVTDDYAPRVWILQTPSLAVFDLQVLDNNGNPVEVVCSGDTNSPPAAYQVRFSLTVPAGHPLVENATPQLTVRGEPQPVPASAPVDIGPGQTVTYTYSLTAPGDAFVGDIALVADATAKVAGTDTDVPDVLSRQAVLRVSDCKSAPPTITASPKPPSVGPQLSGWAPVFNGETYTIRLLAEDAGGGIQSIEYKLTGANQPPPVNPIEYYGAPSPQHYDVKLEEMGDTRIEFRSWDNDRLPSPWQVLDLRLVRVYDLRHDEGTSVSMSIGDPLPGSGVTFSANLPPGLTINPSTGLITGTFGYAAAAGSPYTAVVTESAVGEVSTTVTFMWTVTNVNRTPVARNDSYSTNEDVPLTVAAPGVLVNDSDADADPLTAIVTTGPSHGTVVLNADRSFLYTPAADYHGSDAFSYKVNDGSADSNEATVAIAVLSVNDLPTAVNDAATMSEDGGALPIAVLANDSDVEGALTVTAVTQPASGSVSFTATGVSFTPVSNFSGTATFTYTVTDSNGAKATATVTVTVNSVNDPPVARNDSYSTGENTPLIVAAPGVLGNDSDVDTTSLTVSLVSGPSSVTLGLNADGSFVYQPALNFQGSVTFIYRVNDGSADSNNATVTIQVGIPPVCNAVVTPAVIRPANHKQVYLSLGGITDIRFTSILQDEPTDSPGQGNTLQDAGIEQSGARAWVRAERSGTGDGRIYLISFTGRNGALARCTGTVTVAVPHDQKRPAVLSPGRWNSSGR